MRPNRFFAILAGTTLLALAGRPAGAQPCTPPTCTLPPPTQWAAEGVPASTATSRQALPRIVADGQGGAIMAWRDERETVPTVYVQRVSATGQILWCTNGLPIDYCSPHPYGQLDYSLLATGDGGAIFSWMNITSYGSDIYAQRLASTGSKLWGDGGVPISVSPQTSRSGLVSTLGSGGYAFLAWSDARSTNGSDRIYAQKINTSTGAVAWTTDGRQVNLGDYLPGSTYPSIVEDGSGGMVAVWKLAHNLDDGNIHGQRLDANGNRLWGSDVEVCTGVPAFGSIQQSPRVILSRNGPALQYNVMWTDNRLSSLDLFGQGLNTSGQRLWGEAGVPLVWGPENQIGEIVPDGAGGLLIGWFTQYASDGVWMKRFSSTGASVWFQPLHVFTGWAQNVHLTPNGTNGALVTWDNELASGGPELAAYVQGVRADQLLTWQVGGVPVSNRTEPERNIVAASDGAGGAIVSWEVGAVLSSDIYVARVTPPPDGGHGHCPFLDTWSAGTWQEENSILGRSTTGELLRDVYRLAHAPDAPDGTVRLRVREDEQERTRLAEAKLLVVDRDPNQVSWVQDGRVVLGTRVPVARVTSSTGEDLTARLRDPAGEGLDFAPGTILNVVLYDSGEPQSGSVKIDLAGLMIRPSKKEFDRATAPKDDGEVLALTGIRVEEPDGRGGWVELARIRPRERAADLAVTAARELRLVFVGRHRVHSLSWARADADARAGAELKPASASHSATGEIAGRLSGRGEVTLSPGERIELAFSVPVLPEGKVRDYYFVARGVYTTITDGDRGTLAGVPKAVELYDARPNPTTGSARLAFGLPSSAQVRISVFDVAGRMVSRPVDGPFEAGRHEVTWNLRSNDGTRVGSGLYFYRMEVGRWRQERKLVVR